MARRYWSCRRCKYRNIRTNSPKCQGCGEATKPKKRVPKHAVVLRDMPYEDWVPLSVQIHGGEEHHCAVCGRAPTRVKRHDRDHDHYTHKARGLACSYCNRERLRGIKDSAEALWVLEYFKRVENYYQTEESE